jgi:hypothetical protein
MSESQSRIDQLTTLHNEAASKLDYFILGATLAICAYLAQTNPYGQVGINEETFLLLSLLIFAASATCGFKKIESGISALRMNAVALGYPDEQGRAYLVSKIRKDNTSYHWYQGRNFLLLLGLACYLVTKVSASY